MSQATSFTSAFQQIALSLGITVGASILQLSLAVRHSETLTASDFVPAFMVVGFIAARLLTSALPGCRKMPGKKWPAGNGWVQRRWPWRTDGAEEMANAVVQSESDGKALKRDDARKLRRKIANSVSSGVGLLAVMAGIPLLVGSAIQRRNGFSLAGTIIFAGRWSSSISPRRSITRYRRAGSNGSFICLIIRRSTFSSPAPTPLSRWERCAAFGVGYFLAWSGVWRCSASRSKCLAG